MRVWASYAQSERPHVKPKRSIIFTILCGGLVAIFAAQPFAGTVVPLSCDLPERQGGQHSTQGAIACYRGRGCPTCLHSSDCEISGDPLISSGILPETFACAWKSLISYSHARNTLPACPSLASRKLHSELLAGIRPSPGLPIFLLDLTLII